MKMKQNRNIKNLILLKTILFLIFFSSFTWLRAEVKTNHSEMNDRSESYWDEKAKKIQNAIIQKVNASKIDIGLVIKNSAPEYFQNLTRESQYQEFKDLWGESVNFDESAQKEILSPEIVDEIIKIFKVQPRKDRVVHAGLEHAYGYLLSTLQTKYGYKRDRWINPDIELGFALKEGDLSPFPKGGGLFSNLTFIAGKIAFRNEPVALQILENSKWNQGVSSTLKVFDFKKLKPTRLTELISLKEGHQIVLRTDFIPFLFKNNFSKNDAILIYSVKDSSMANPYLITMFPLVLSSVLPIPPDTLGENKLIKTRWNAFVPGVTNSTTPINGTRNYE